VIEPLQNSTVDFVTVVGQVYYEKRNNANIAHKKVTYLLEHWRDHYRLKTNKLDYEFIDHLSKKTGIDKRLASDLVDILNYINVQQQVTDHELINLNKLIEKFYSQSAYNGK
jgi:ABC-type taurine transport system substrate-binding protein